MERKNVSAFTPPWDGSEPGNVPYYSLNQEADGSYTLHVRGKQQERIVDSIGTPETVQPEATIVLPGKQELLMLMVDIGSHIYGEDIMVKGAAFFLEAALAKTTVVDDASEETPANDGAE